MTPTTYDTRASQIATEGYYGEYAPSPVAYGPLRVASPVPDRESRRGRDQKRRSRMDMRTSSEDVIGAYQVPLGGYENENGDISYP
jgi:hypothetical protein